METHPHMDAITRMLELWLDRLNTEDAQDCNLFVASLVESNGTFRKPSESLSQPCPYLFPDALSLLRNKLDEVRVWRARDNSLAGMQVNLLLRALEQAQQLIRLATVHLGSAEVPLAVVHYLDDLGDLHRQILQLLAEISYQGVTGPLYRDSSRLARQGAAPQFLI